jgi:hypothetical protein
MVEVEYRDLKIKVNEVRGTPLLLAQGLIRLNNGGADFSPNYKNFGISSLELTTYSLKVTLDSKVVSKPGANPIIHVTGTPDHPEVPLAGSFNPTDSTLLIKWTNGIAFQNLMNRTAYVFLTVSI